MNLFLSFGDNYHEADFYIIKFYVMKKFLLFLLVLILAMTAYADHGLGDNKDLSLTFTFHRDKKPDRQITVTNPVTGRIWMDRNLGAKQVATAIDDADSYGGLYQWGRFSDGHQSRRSETLRSQASTVWISKNGPWYGKFLIGYSDWLSTSGGDLWQGVKGRNNPCPQGFRIPTDAEWEAERMSWDSNNASGAFNSALKLPSAGYRTHSNGSMGHIGKMGRYWSSTVEGDLSHYLLFTDSFAGIYSLYRANGNSVRCIKD